MSAALDPAEAERRADALLIAGWTRKGDRWAPPSLKAFAICRSRRGLSLADAWTLNELIGATRRHLAERVR